MKTTTVDPIAELGGAQPGQALGAVAPTAAAQTVQGGSAHVPVEIVVHGRGVVVPEHYRQHVVDKLSKLERYDGKICRVDVELEHERNPRQGGSCQHIEITCRTRGPVVRSEACAEDFYKALDQATDRLERRLRQAADRRRVHHGRRRPQALHDLPAELLDTSAAGLSAAAEDEPDGPGRVVREKQHAGVPMSVDDALFEMELVGHDFFLFHDRDNDCASVVYRRHAYDYGLIRLA